jgi:hypothetical protein
MNLYLVIGPGPVETRQRLLELTRDNRPLNAYHSIGLQSCLHLNRVSLHFYEFEL